MNTFDKLVDAAIKNQPNLALLKVVVEKELLHHDILRIMSQNNLLDPLTFIGGTCLRCCYGSPRLSEDLDFTGGADFTRNQLSIMGEILIDNLSEKYQLLVKVSEPIKDSTNVSTWKLKIETRPGQSDIPTQRINIDICSVTSYEMQPARLLNHYRVDMGTRGLAINAQSLEEIYTDKLLAFAGRINRIKYRDLWDILWLDQQGIKPRLELIKNKLDERNLSFNHFIQTYAERRESLSSDPSIKSGYKAEMQRFLTTEEVARTVDNDGLWLFLVDHMADLERQIKRLYG
ncbi:MAG: nucleotidyl transferase AbiEii/AbiGii toxin family protein [Pseudomonadota bacterium]